MKEYWLVILGVLILVFLLVFLTVSHATEPRKPEIVVLHSADVIPNVNHTTWDYSHPNHGFCFYWPTETVGRPLTTYLKLHDRYKALTFYAFDDSVEFILHQTMVAYSVSDINLCPKSVTF